MKLQHYWPRGKPCQALVQQHKACKEDSDFSGGFLFF